MRRCAAYPYLPSFLTDASHFMVGVSLPTELRTEHPETVCRAPVPPLFLDEGISFRGTNTEVTSTKSRKCLTEHPGTVYAPVYAGSQWVIRSPVRCLGALGVTTTTTPARCKQHAVNLESVTETLNLCSLVCNVAEHHSESNFRQLVQLCHGYQKNSVMGI